MRVERGATTAHQSLPAPLLEAEAILSKYASGHRDDPKWMQLQARAALLEWDYETAIRKIDDALMLKPDDSELLVDRATALYGRAGNARLPSVIDYGEAAEDLSRSVDLNPRNGIALFNRALVFEKLWLPKEAIEDFEGYLRLEPRSDWAGEASAHLDSLKKLVSDHEVAQREPLADPTIFARLTEYPEGKAKLDKRVEEYQDLAIDKWLPLAFPVKKNTTNGPRRESLAGLHALARILRERHHDKWLEDLLLSSDTSHRFALGIESIKNARLSNGASDEALQAARRAVELFRKGNLPAKLRAEVELVHSLQRHQANSRCRGAAKSVRRELSGRSYSWIETQLAIDDSACSLTEARFEEGAARIDEAISLAERSAFPVLALRAAGIAISGKNFSGDVASTWAGDLDGLARYWQNFLPSVRAHQFYDDLSYTAELLNEPHVALALAEESVATLSEKASSEVAVSTRNHLAKISGDLGNLVEVGDLRVPSAFTPGRDKQHAFDLFNLLMQAEIDMRKGDLNSAERHLQAATIYLRSNESMSLSLTFHRDRAELFALKGAHKESEAELTEALTQVKSVQFSSASKSRESWTQENSALFRSLVYTEILNGSPDKALNVWEIFMAGGLDAKVQGKGINDEIAWNSVRDFTKGAPGATFVTYVLVPRGLLSFVARNGGVKFHFNTLDSTRLASQGTNFLRACSDPQTDLETIKIGARRLFDVFISPIDKDIARGSALIIEADPSLGDFPFQALLSPDGRYVGETFDLSQSPGVLYQIHSRSAESLSPEMKALVVGSTANVGPQGETFQPDQDSLGEAKEVSGRFVNPVVLQSDNATRENVAINFQDADVFHFVGHAISGAKEEGLLLAGSRRQNRDSYLWTSRELNSKSLRKCRLAVLSACTTGKTYVTSKETHGDLVRKLLSIGVPNVVASRWNVDSVQTRRFIKAFYDAVLAGRSVARAVRQAETLLMHDPATAHPYYWAAFSDFGHN